jgi:hypothetical protein
LVSDPERLVIYGDFNCPFSALASQRAAALEECGEVVVEWRAVGHDPSIPTEGRSIIGEARRALEHELAQIDALMLPGETAALTVPTIQSSTWLVNLAFAGSPTDDRPALRGLVFDAYWRRGQDLTDPATVRRLCGQHTDVHLTADWQATWKALPSPIVPTVVLPDGHVSRGLGALARLATRISAMDTSAPVLR